MSSPSALDRPITLAELVDAASLDEVLRSFAEFHVLALQVIDAAGAPLVTVGAPSPLCELVCEGEAGRARCAAKQADARRAAAADGTLGPGGAAAPECFCGQRWQAVPLEHDGSRLGALVVGPYWPDGRPRQPTGALQSLVGAGNLDALEAALHNLHALGDTAAHRVLEHLSRVMNVVLHAAYARHLAGQLHLAAIQDAYAELTDKNRRLGEAVERMQEADRIKSNFLATVSHELRTPLTSVIGYSEMLLEGLAGSLNEEQKEYVHTIMEKGDALLQIISGMLDVSRMEAGTLRLERGPVDLRDVIVTAATQLAPAFKKKRLSLSTPAADGEALLVVGDRDKIRQILMNLLGNAIKFTPEGGQIQVDIGVGALGRDGEQARFADDARRAVHLRVRDNGIGIPKEKQQRIFEPFFQVDSSSTREYGGTGLGLTLVKSLVEAQGGHVWVESELGQGSLFIVTLPVHEDSAAGG
jgi:signal transduction histidine kinase